MLMFCYTHRYQFVTLFTFAIMFTGDNKAFLYLSYLIMLAPWTLLSGYTDNKQWTCLLNYKMTRIAKYLPVLRPRVWTPRTHLVICKKKLNIWYQINNAGWGFITYELACFPVIPWLWIYISSVPQPNWSAYSQMNSLCLVNIIVPCSYSTLTWMTDKCIISQFGNLPFLFPNRYFPRIYPNDSKFVLLGPFPRFPCDAWLLCTRRKQP